MAPHVPVLLPSLHEKVAEILRNGGATLPKSVHDSFRVICEHIERLEEATLPQ